MERDRTGIPLVFIVYNRIKQGTYGFGLHRVATFKDPKNADKFLQDEDNADLFISCNAATIKDLSLARD